MKRFFTHAIIAMIASLAFAQIGHETSGSVLHQADNSSVAIKSKRDFNVLPNAVTRTVDLSQPYVAPQAKQVKTGAASVVTDAHGIITSVEGGEARVYNRSTNAFYAEVSDSQVKYYYQKGITNVIVDGDDWYIQDIICNIGFGTWVKGHLNEDGSKLVIPAGQMIYWNTNGYGLTVNYGDYVSNSWVKNNTDITYTIDGDNLILDGAHASVSGGYINFEDAVLGAFWTNDDTWAGYGDWNTALTYNPDYVAPSTDLVVLPEDAEVVKWYMIATDVRDNNSSIDQTVNVAFVGNDVYVQGIFASKFPNAWIKGTIEGTTVTFPNAQYIGSPSSGSEDTWAQGYNTVTGELCDFTADFDKETLTITGNVELLANCDVNRLWYYDRYSDIEFSAWADTGYVTVGTGTSSSSIYPYGTIVKYSTTQSIYTAEEIGMSGTIRTIAYKVASSGSLSTTSVTIYMGHTSMSSFSSPSDYLNVSNMTLVYSGSPTLATQTGWEELTLSTPFAYNGTDNLVIVVGRQSNSHNGSATYYYSTTSSYQCLSRSTDGSSSYGNPSTTGNYSKSSSRANVRLGFDAKEIGQFSYIFTSDTTATICGTTASGDVNIPSSLTIVDKNYTVTAISGGAFRNKTDITSITIPSSVTSIGDYAFYGCSSLTSLSIPSSVTSIGSSAFYGCTGKLTVNCNIGSASGSDGWFYGSEFSSVEISKDVTSIGNYAFYENSNIQSLTIGSGVTTIGSNAFNYSPTKTIWLTNTPPSGYSVAKGKVNYVSNNNFTSLSNTKVYAYLSSMFEADGIKYVPVNPSERTCDAIDYTYLTQDSIVTIGQTVSYRNIAMAVKHINDYVAYENSNIKDLTIDADCDINQYAFYQSTNLQKVNLNNTGNIGSYAFYGCTALQSAQISNTGNIGSQAFDGCTALQSAQISNIGDIGSQAFYGCSQLSTCTVGDAVTAVGDKAFYSCSSLPAIQLGKNIKTIGSYAFYGCSKLQEIAIPDATTSLGTYCFSGCKALTTVSTGDGIVAIPQYAFYNCSALNSITIGEGVKTIDPHAFQNCLALEDIAIPSNVTKIDDDAFSGCKKLADVVIADRNEALTLGYNGSSKPLFSDCPLDSLYIGGKISYNTSSSYGYSPFYRNTSLRTVVITDEETEIYANEFYGCSNLQNVKIGDGVKKIGNYAFSGCSSLESFGFGSGTQSIGLEAFSDCTALTSIATKATNPPACGTQALDDINKWDCTLYVPEASVSAYQAADQWKDFFFVSTIEGSNIGDNDEFEGVHRFIRDGERFQNTLARDYDTVTYVRNFECYDWEAVYLPFSMNYDDWKEDFDVARINAFYQYDDDDNGTIDRSVLQAIKVKSGELRHNFPYLIRAKVPGAKSIDLLNTTVHTSKVTSVDCSTVSTQFTFVGTYNTLSGANFSGKNVYTLENGQLAPIAANGTIPSCRWYIEVEARTIDAPAMNAHSIHINVFEDEDEMETAIEEISEKTASAPIYSVEGFRVDENRMNRGVFMQNGRKFIRR